MVALKPSSAKQKGRLFQQEVRDRILADYPNLEPDDVRSTSMGAGGTDIQLSPAAKKEFPYAVECKSLAESAAHRYYNQACAHAKVSGGEPLAIVKINRRPAVAIISFDHFMGLTKNAIRFS